MAFSWWRAITLTSNAVEYRTGASWEISWCFSGTIRLPSFQKLKPLFSSIAYYNKSIGVKEPDRSKNISANLFMSLKETWNTQRSPTLKQCKMSVRCRWQHFCAIWCPQQAAPRRPAPQETPYSTVEIPGLFPIVAGNVHFSWQTCVQMQYLPFLLQPVLPLHVFSLTPKRL